MHECFSVTFVTTIFLSCPPASHTSHQNFIPEHDGGWNDRLDSVHCASLNQSFRLAMTFCSCACSLQQSICQGSCCKHENLAVKHLPSRTLCASRTYCRFSYRILD